MLVADLRERLEYREYVGWMQYYTYNPPHFERHQLAALCSMINNAFSKRKRRMHHYLPARKPHRSPEEIEIEMMVFARQHNARERQKREQ